MIMRRPSVNKCNEEAIVRGRQARERVIVVGGPAASNTMLGPSFVSELLLRIHYSVYIGHMAQRAYQCAPAGAI